MLLWLVIWYDYIFGFKMVYSGFFLFLTLSHFLNLCWFLMWNVIHVRQGLNLNPWAIDCYYLLIDGIHFFVLLVSQSLVRISFLALYSWVFQFGHSNWGVNVNVNRCLFIHLEYHFSIFIPPFHSSVIPL